MFRLEGIGSVWTYSLNFITWTGTAVISGVRGYIEDPNAQEPAQTIIDHFQVGMRPRTMRTCVARSNCASPGGASRQPPERRRCRHP